jgi:hypothetical protein
MKTILRIVIILLVAALVAGGFSLGVNNTSIASDAGEGRQPPAMTSADGQSVQPMARPEGGDGDSASISRGLSGVLTTLAKLTGVSILVLVLQKAFGQIQRLKLKPAR